MARYMLKVTHMLYVDKFQNVLSHEWFVSFIVRVDKYFVVYEFDV